MKNLTPAQNKLLKKINNASCNTISLTMISYYGELQAANNLVRKGVLKNIVQDNGIIVFKKI